MNNDGLRMFVLMKIVDGQDRFLARGPRAWVDNLGLARLFTPEEAEVALMLSDHDAFAFRVWLSIPLGEEEGRAA